MAAISTKVGDDDPKAWNNQHLQHAWLWLVHNEASPYKGAPTMLLACMGFQRYSFKALKNHFPRAMFDVYRFTFRLRATEGFKRVINGLVVPKVIKRNKLGHVIKFEVLRADDPKPLPYPPFYRGNIRLTAKGMILQFRRTDEMLIKRHDPEGVRRLQNPFGVR